MLFELMFVVYLLHMLDSAEAAVDRATNAKVAVSSANRLLTLFYNAGTALVGYRDTQDQAMIAQFDAAIKDIPGQLEMLEGALSSQPSGKQAFRRASLLCDRSLDMLDRYKHRAMLTRSKFPYEGALPMSIQMDLMSKELIREMNLLVQEYKSGNYSMEAAIASRNQLRVFILLGTILSVVLAVCLALAFKNGTVRRLSILMQNTIHLSKQEQLQPLLTGRDEIAQLDAVFHRVNDTLLAAERERKAIEQLKRDFLNMITHDLRSPLASISVAMEVLQAGVYGQLSDQGRKYLSFTDIAVTYMRGLVDDLLDCERLESGEFPIATSAQDIYLIAEQAVSTLANLLQSRNITVQIAEFEHEVIADPTRIQQVITNLLHNAIKYSPDRAAIRIEFDNLGSQVETRIVDEGRGIPAEVQETIFDRFRQADITDATVKRGSGLGLYLCKSIIELHGGKIGVRSKSGEGSTFWFTLPLAPETEL